MVQSEFHIYVVMYYYVILINDKVVYRQLYAFEKVKRDKEFDAIRAVMGGIQVGNF